MRASVAALILCAAACQSQAPAGAELTRPQCADLVRHVQRLESADTGGMRDALNVGLRSGIDGCLANGTERAYRCVLVAETMHDLESCNALFK
jgi:hypothetical protein